MKMRLSCVDAVIAPTKKVERTLREYGLTESEIAVIPSGICLDKFQQPCEEEKSNSFGSSMIFQRRRGCC